MKKVLLYESMDEHGIGFLRQNGCEVLFAESLEEDALVRLASDVDAIVIRANGSVTARIMDAAPKLKVIGRHGVGIESIDCDAAAQRGIYVVNTPDANTEAVAETTVGMMLAIAKRMCEANQQIHCGDWRARYRLIGSNLTGRTLGVVGLGRIGRRIAQIARDGFGMKVLFYDAVEIDCEHEQVDLDSLLARADFVSVNLPLTSQTRGILGAERLARMKEGSYLVNTSRGGIVDEAAVAEMVRVGHIAGAAFDVFAREPIEPQNPLLNDPRILLTPHMAAHSKEAMIAMSMVAEDIVRVLNGRPPRYPANSPGKPKP